MGFGDEPKNLRLSIHNKYKRRLKLLSHILADFIHHAEQKLDSSVAGTIYNRTEIEQITKKAKELATLLPSPEDIMDYPPVAEDFLEVLQKAEKETEQIMSEADEFTKNLSPEEWDEIVRSYREDT